MESKKHYNLSTTEDNGQSITTTNTSTEHPAEILRMMQLAGIQGSPVVHQHEEIEEEVESEFKPTPANDKLDLDDYSKKSPESINKQPKTLQPTLGDNPLEYSIDESEIFEGLMKEFNESEQIAEERTDEIIPVIGAALGALARGVVGAAVRNPGTALKVASNVLGSSPKEEPVNASSKKKGAKLNAVKEESTACHYDDCDGDIVSGACDECGSEALDEAQSPAQKAAFAKMLAAKKGKTEPTMKDEPKANDDKKEPTISEAEEKCSCGHDSDCDCSSDCDCGCNAVNEAQARLAKLVKY